MAKFSIGNGQNPGMDRMDIFLLQLAVCWAKQCVQCVVTTVLTFYSTWVEDGGVIVYVAK